MELYLVRHGETDYNKNRLLQGRTDIPLNEKGIKQAVQTKASLEHIFFDFIISSPLIRAKQTASIIAPGKMIHIDPRLVERSLGNFEGKSVDLYPFDQYYDYHLNCTDEHVEGICEFIERIREFINELKIEHPNKTILLVTHNGWISVFRYCLEKIPENGNLMRNFLDNGEYIKYSL